MTMRTRDWGLTLGLVVSLGLGCAQLDDGVGDEDGIDEPGLEEAESVLDSWGRDPVIFMHGCPPPGVTSDQASHFFDTMVQFMISRGYPPSYLHKFVLSGPVCNSNQENANQLASLVQSVRAVTGKPKVDLVVHSMGALGARLYITQGGYNYVNEVVMVGGGNHGAVTAAAGIDWQNMFGYPNYEGLQEMYPPYACQGQASGQPTADTQFTLNGCLTATGRTVQRDETPFEPTVQYRSIRNTLDEIAVPVQTACLNMRWQNDCASPVNTSVSVGPGPGPCGPEGCPGHVTMLWNQTVMQQVFGFITLRSSGGYDPSL